MYALFDTFHARIISRHRSPEAVARADRRCQRAAQRANGPTSCVSTAIVRIVQGEIARASWQDWAIFLNANRDKGPCRRRRLLGAIRDALGLTVARTRGGET